MIVFEDFYSSGTDESIARVTRWLGVPTAPITQPLGYRAYNWYVLTADIINELKLEGS